jgi:hypothetical protein
LLCAALAVFGLSTGCGKDASPTTPSPVAASPTATAIFSGSLAVSGSRFYSFSVLQYGTVNVTLSSVTGPDVPEDVQLLLAIGRPRGIDCSPTSTFTTAAGDGPHITGNYDPGVYCVRLSDNGNLPGPANFVVTIAHP